MVAVVIPSYRVKKHILELLCRIGNEIDKIYVIDDVCPEMTGQYVLDNRKDPRITVIFNKENKGVGGAVMVGYAHALADGADIIVKLDGDGQMDPDYIKKLIAPIQNNEADYCKGNRFYDLEKLLIMPKIRLFGNSILSLLNKFVNGYWNIVDPTNGYTAIHRNALAVLPLHKIDRRYFFESDMLFRLSTIRAVVKDISIPAIYKDEKSNLKIGRVLFEFPFKYLNRFIKRLFYSYLLKDFNSGSIQLFFGLLFLIIGVSFGVYHWILSLTTLIAATSGTVMISGLLVILGFQLLLGALNFDVQNIPRKPIHNDL